jgi:hypothetical protein
MLGTLLYSTDRETQSLLHSLVDDVASDMVVT